MCKSLPIVKLSGNDFIDPPLIHSLPGIVKLSGNDRIGVSDIAKLPRIVISSGNVSTKVFERSKLPTVKFFGNVFISLRDMCNSPVTVNPSGNDVNPDAYKFK